MKSPTKIIKPFHQSKGYPNTQWFYENGRVIRRYPGGSDAGGETDPQKCLAHWASLWGGQDPVEAEQMTKALREAMAAADDHDADDHDATTCATCAAVDPHQTENGAAGVNAGSASAARTVYEALPNDANDKRAHGSWKVCVRQYDADGRMVRAQKYAQEIYSEAHARKIASALNEDAAAPALLAVVNSVVSSYANGSGTITHFMWAAGAAAILRATEMK